MNCFLLLLLIILGLDTLNIYIKFDHSKFGLKNHQEFIFNYLFHLRKIQILILCQYLLPVFYLFLWLDHYFYPLFIFVEMILFINLH